jgi:hypothetical protein
MGETAPHFPSTGACSDRCSLSLLSSPPALLFRLSFGCFAPGPGRDRTAAVVGFRVPFFRQSRERPDELGWNEKEATGVLAGGECESRKAVPAR